MTAVNFSISIVRKEQKTIKVLYGKNLGIDITDMLGLACRNVARGEEWPDFVNKAHIYP